MSNGKVVEEPVIVKDISPSVSEGNMVILDERIDPIHHNFIRYGSPVPSTESIISEYFDEADPMEIISNESTLAERFANTFAKKVNQFNDLIGQLQLQLPILTYGSSQYSENESEINSDSDSESESDESKEVGIVPQSSSPVPLVNESIYEDNDAFEIISSPHINPLGLGN